MPTCLGSRNPKPYGGTEDLSRQPNLRRGVKRNGERGFYRDLECRSRAPRGMSRTPAFLPQQSILSRSTMRNFAAAHASPRSQKRAH